MASVQVDGLAPLLTQLKGPLFKDVNKALRSHARMIAKDLQPEITRAVSRSRAPQADAMAKTARAHSDRVPVVVVGKVNPRFSSGFKGGNTRRRRGAIALGVVAGPAGRVNYYKIGRDPSWGPLGDALQGGPIMDHAADLYLRLFMAELRAHGFEAI